MLTYLFLCLFITNVYAETVETPYLVADTSTDKTREIMKEEEKTEGLLTEEEKWKEEKILKTMNKMKLKILMTKLKVEMQL